MGPTFVHFYKANFSKINSRKYLNSCFKFLKLKKNRGKVLIKRNSPLNRKNSYLTWRGVASEAMTAPFVDGVLRGGGGGCEGFLIFSVFSGVFILSNSA